MKAPLWLLTAFLPALVQAGPRTSAAYSIATEIADAGGRRATSASYTNDGSAGAVAGLSTVAAPAETAKHGYIGQLFDVTGLTLTSASSNVNEGATLQLAAWQTLDDATFLSVPAASVTWSVTSGPLGGISTGGLATAGTVYQDTAATARGSYLGNASALGLTVKNVNLDDFGSYAGDGIDDAWQNQYFGLNNPNAGPAVDADRDGANNLFEYLAGVSPVDPLSRFTLKIQPVAGPSPPRTLIFTPIVAGRTYTVQFTSTLAPAAWQPLSGASQSDNGATRTVTDTSAAGARYYRVQVAKP